MNLDHNHHKPEYHMVSYMSYPTKVHDISNICVGYTPICAMVKSWLHPHSFKCTDPTTRVRGCVIMDLWVHARVESKVGLRTASRRSSLIDSVKKKNIKGWMTITCMRIIGHDTNSQIFILFPHHIPLFSCLFGRTSYYCTFPSHIPGVFPITYPFKRQ